MEASASEAHEQDPKNTGNARTKKPNEPKRSPKQQQNEPNGVETQRTSQKDLNLKNRPPHSKLSS